MEAVEAFLDGEWDSLSKLFSCEDSDPLLHCNSSNLVSYNGEIPWNNLSHGSENVGANLLLPSENLDHTATSFYSVSQESSHSSSEIESSLFALLGDENRPVAANAGGFTNTFDQSMFTDDLMEEILQLKASILCNDELQNEGMLSRPKERDDDSCKKRPRQTSKRNAETKKAKRGAKTSINNINEEEMKNNGSSSSYCSEGDDCNASEELNGGSTSESTTTKKKASKSPATDPQSLYARKRRERINERLRILQNLVPNGTKVDISTMLEEAVDYVKFLQLQIKLLSSDDMWMYAPIAYNGMDMGLYQKIIPNL